MATLLKRFSASLGRDSDAKPMPSTVSFSDFSMHVGQDHCDVNDSPAASAQPGSARAAPWHARTVSDYQQQQSPFTVGSAPAASTFGGLTKQGSSSLRIPHTSMAHLLTGRSLGFPPSSSADSGTPRSSMDHSSPTASGSSSLPPTPGGGSSLGRGGSPRGPPPLSLSTGGGPGTALLGGAADPQDQQPPTPRSPRSPTTPGGRRRKNQQKIDGMDYYEFCELIRSSSL